MTDGNWSDDADYWLCRHAWLPLKPKQALQLRPLILLIFTRRLPCHSNGLYTSPSWILWLHSFMFRWQKWFLRFYWFTWKWRSKWSSHTCKTRFQWSKVNCSGSSVEEQFMYYRTTVPGLYYITFLNVPLLVISRSICLSLCLCLSHFLVWRLLITCWP